MLFFLSFLALGCELGNSQQTELSQVLGRMENTMSTLNLRLARIEARQTRNMLIYSRLEGNIKDVKNELDSKHGETMLWLRNTVTLLNDLKFKDDKLEAGQIIMSENLQRVMNKTFECCRNDTIIVRCPSSTSVSLTKPVTSTITTTTVRPTTTISTTPAPASTTPATSSSTTAPAPKDCKSVNQGGNLKDGVYKLELAGKRSIQVYCSAGYVTIQRRFNGAVKFDRSFAEYEQGFGDVYAEHWLGLTYQHELTSSRSCSVKILLDIDSTTRVNRDSYRCGDKRYTSDCDGKTKEILASNFRISSASDLYRVQVTWKSSDFTHPAVKNYGIDRMNGQQFSCKDKGPERRGCAGVGEVPAGFWYGSVCNYPNTVYTTTDTYYCSSSNQVCGVWYPYFFTTSWIQFSC